MHRVYNPSPARIVSLWRTYGWARLRWTRDMATDDHYIDILPVRK